MVHPDVQHFRELRMKLEHERAAKAQTQAKEETCNCEHCRKERADKAASELQDKIIERRPGDFIPELSPDYDG
jgi:hypothetical protein